MDIHLLWGDVYVVVLVTRVERSDSFDGVTGNAGRACCDVPRDTRVEDEEYVLIQHRIQSDHCLKRLNKLGYLRGAGEEVFIESSRSTVLDRLSAVPARTKAR